MPRTNGSTSSRSSNIGFSRSTYNTPPKPIQNVQSQVVQHQVQSPSIGTSIKDGIASGFGWGIGTSIAKSMFGGGSTQTVVHTPEQQPKQEQNSKCLIEQNEFMSCLKTNGTGMCYDMEEKLKKCMEK
jgi:hypothetical protein